MSTLGRTITRERMGPEALKEMKLELGTCLYCSEICDTLCFWDIRDRLNVSTKPWNFWRCSTCGSAALCPRPENDELAPLYPLAYHANSPLTKGVKRFLSRLENFFFYRFHSRAQMDAATRCLPKTEETRRLLDLGCGTGTRLLLFRKLGFEVCGIDFEPHMARFVRDELRLPVICAPVSELSKNYSPSSFDVITAFYILEHLNDVNSVIQDCLNLLKPGGWFISAIPLADSLQAQLLKRSWAAVTEAPRHLSLPTRDGITRALKRCGFQSVVLCPDSTLLCAGMLALSLFPAANSANTYGNETFRGLPVRWLGGMATLALLPWCWVENYWVKRPACALVSAQKTAMGNGS